MRRVVSVCWLLVVIAACGQVQPVLMNVSMPDCTYRGAEEMTEGRARLNLTINGIGEWGAALVQLDEDHDFGDLDSAAGESSDLADLPEWARVMIELRLSDEDGRDGVDAERVLDEGFYSVICVFPGDDETGATYIPLEGIRVERS